jgi:hypothetical protein
MTALGLYTGSNAPHEHAEEAGRLGGPASYRMRLANALLGAVQTETILAETSDVTDDQRAAAHRQQLVTAGVEDDPVKLIEFLRWQVLRAATPPRDRPATGGRAYPAGRRPCRRGAPATARRHRHRTEPDRGGSAAPRPTGRSPGASQRRRQRRCPAARPVRFKLPTQAPCSRCKRLTHPRAGWSDVGRPKVVRFAQTALANRSSLT